MRTLAISASAVLCLASFPALAADVGPESVLPASPKPAHAPAVAFGAGKYLVVWESGRAEAADLYGCRLDESGKALDAQPFVISGAKECQDRPRVAWGKDSWLVVWEDVRGDRDFDVYAARVSADGKCLDPDGILVAGGDNNQCNPDVAFNGENFLVAWRSWEGNKYLAAGARVSSDGKVLDATPLALSPGLKAETGVGEPKVASAGGKWIVAWASRGYGSPGAPGGPAGLFVSVVTGDGKAALSHMIKNQGMDNVKSPATAASNGKDGFLFSWYNGTTGGRSGSGHGMPYGAALCDLDGKQTGTTVLGGPKAHIQMPSATFDGRGYAVAFYVGGRRHRDQGGGLTNTVAVHLIAADGKYEGRAEISSTAGYDDKTPLNPPFAPAACGGGDGKTLVVYEKHPARAGDGSVIAARMVRR
jgi:hypothetical protein